MKAFEKLAGDVAELKRQMGNLIRPATVKSNKGNGMVEVEDGTGLVANVPQASLSAGHFKFDAPAEAGAQGVLFSPSGDPAQAIFLPCLPTRDTPAATTQTGTVRLEFGQAGITINDGVIVIEGAEVQIKGNKIITDGPTHLNNGERLISTIAGPANQVFSA